MGQGFLSLCPTSMPKILGISLGLGCFLVLALLSEISLARDSKHSTADSAASAQKGITLARERPPQPGVARSDEVGSTPCRYRSQAQGWSRDCPLCHDFRQPRCRSGSRAVVEPCVP